MKKAIKILATLPLIFLLVIYLWPDDPLTADSRRMLMAQTELSPSPDAMAYGLWGMEAPTGEDIWAHGRAMVDSFRFLGEPLVVREPLRFSSEVLSLCRLHQSGCVDESMASVSETTAWMDEHAELMQRYAALKRATDLRPVIDLGYETPFPPYRALRTASALLTRHGLALAASGDREAGLALVQEEIRFARSLMAGAPDLLTKMVGAAMLAENVRALHAVGAPPPARLSESEKSMLRVLYSEASYGTRTLTLLRDRKGLSILLELEGTTAWVAQFFTYLPNRTTNQLVANITDSARALGRDAIGMEVARAEVLERSVGFWEWMVNAAGASLMDIRSDYLSYALRMHELDALIVLAQVAERMRAEGVTAEAAEEWLAALPEGLRSPYGNAAPAWQDGTLSFWRRSPVSKSCVRSCRSHSRLLAWRARS